MDWENARWVKLYCQDTGTWLRIGWQGRTVALHLLRAVNASGVLSDLGEEPDLVLSELLRLPAEVVTPGLAALVRTETVTLAHGKLVWTKFLEAQKSRKSEAQRKAEYRAKHRAEAINAQGGTACPKCGTDNPETGHNCPQCPDKGDIESQNRKEKIRSEENRSDSGVPSKPSQPALPLQPQQAAVGVDDGQAHKTQPEAAGQAKTPTAMPKPQVAKQIALTLFGELQAARKRCNPNIRLDCKIKNATDGIERCLKDGSTPDDIRHVIACWEALVKTGARRMQDFDHMTPFSPTKVGKYLMMTLEDAAKPRPGYSKPAVPEKPKTQPKEPSEWEKRRDAFLREQAEKNKEAENNS